MEHLLHEITPMVSQYGLWIVFFGMITEGTTMIIVTGILCYLGMLPFKETLPVAWLGAVAGDQLWYLTGRYAKEKVLSRFPSLGIRMQKYAPTIEKRGRIMALGSRFIYGGAILFPFTLGAYRYPYKTFTLFDMIGAAIWAAAGLGLGYLVGNGTEAFVGKITYVEHLLLLVAVIAFVVWQVRRYRKIRSSWKTNKW
jgi:membrane protein DedA with SNARE-associated domain